MFCINRDSCRRSKFPSSERFHNNVWCELAASVTQRLIWRRICPSLLQVLPVRWFPDSERLLLCQNWLWTKRRCRTFSKDSWLGSSSGCPIVARDDSVWSRIRDYFFLRREFTKLLLGVESCPGTSPAGQLSNHDSHRRRIRHRIGKQEPEMFLRHPVERWNADSELMITRLTRGPACPSKASSFCELQTSTSWYPTSWSGMFRSNTCVSACTAARRFEQLVCMRTAHWRPIVWHEYGLVCVYCPGWLMVRGGNYDGEDVKVKKEDALFRPSRSVFKGRSRDWADFGSEVGCSLFLIIITRDWQRWPGSSGLWVIWWSLMHKSL